MKSLLLDEQPLLIMPILATKIGLNESIVLQQIHYWLQINKKANKNFKEEKYWTFNSYAEWEKQFPFWSSRTIQRCLLNLEKMRLIQFGNFNKLKIDRTKWYTIDYETLKTLETSPFGQIGTTNMTDWHNHLDKLALPLPEITTETNLQRLNKDIWGIFPRSKFDTHLKTLSKNHLYEKSDAIEAVKCYCQWYFDKTGDHLNYTSEQWNGFIGYILYCDDLGDYEELDVILKAIEHHMSYKYKHKEMYLLHNFKDDVKENRIFESRYLD